MAVQTGQRITLAEFETLAALPENADQRLEYIGGEVYTMVSNAQASNIAARISGYLFMYLMQHDIGHLTGADGGYVIGSERYIPHVAFISAARQPELPRQGYNPLPPDLAVEVISDPGSSDEQDHLRLKVSAYLAAGTTVWVVNPDAQTVELHRAGQPPQVLHPGDTLSGGELLPGFTLKVSNIFPAEQ